MLTYQETAANPMGWPLFSFQGSLTMPSIIVGDIASLAYQGVFDVVFHGCNCHHSNMQNGVAKALSQQFPEIIMADRKTRRGDKTKMGTFSHVTTTAQNGKPLVILNAYTQFFYGRHHYRQGGFDYTSFEELCDRILHRLGGRGVRFGYPLIGGDRGNADPEKILRIIECKFKGEDHTLVLFDEPHRKKHPFVKKLLSKRDFLL